MPHVMRVAILTHINPQLEKEALEKLVSVEGKPDELPAEVKTQVRWMNTFVVLNVYTYMHIL